MSEPTTPSASTFAASDRSSAAVDGPPGHNLVVLVGSITGDPQWRDLPSGSRLLQLSVTVREDGQATTSTPVSWFDPPLSAPGINPGETVVVSGTVVRRFFRAGGATQSRTEVQATAVVPLRRKAQVRRVLAAATKRLGEIEEVMLP